MRRPSSPTSIVDHFANLRSDWDAAQPGRFKRTRRTPASGAHGDYHYRSEPRFLKVIEDARDMERNDSLVAWLLSLSTNLTVLGGIEVQAATGSPELDAALQSEYDAWCLDPEVCDASLEATFYDIQRDAYRSSRRDGDQVLVLREDGRIMRYEAHRVRTPSQSRAKNVIHGVALGPSRERTEYWVTKEDLDINEPLKAVAEVQKFPTRDADGERMVCHVYNTHRTTQSRGVSALAPVFDLCGMKDDLAFAHLVKSQVAAAICFLRTRSIEFNGGAAPPLGVETQNTLADGSVQVLDQIAPGMMITGQPGEGLEAFAPNTPNQEFFAQFRLTLQMISTALGVPLMCALLDGSETNFSGYRGAMDIAKAGWRVNQESLVTQLVRPVYRWRVRHAIEASQAIRRLSRGSEVRDPFGHKPHCPTWPYIQPLQDAATDVMRLRHHLVSPAKYYVERNEDPAEVVRETVAFNRAAIEEAIMRADEINQAHPDLAVPVTWRDLWQQAPPEGVNLSMNLNPADGANNGK